MTNIAVIFAGGSGSRMEGATRPKQFLELGGRPIIAHTIQHFQDHEAVDAIFIACLEPWMGHLRAIVEKQWFSKVRAIVAGGGTCQESIAKGLEAADAYLEGQGMDPSDAVVLVHDGVRPLIDHDTITRCIESVRRYGCTATVSPAQETVVVVDDSGCVRDVLNRASCQLARAPQGFKFDELIEHARRALSEGRNDFIDSVSLMSHYGYQIYTVQGPADNIKITTRRDFFAFKGYTDYEEMEQLWVD